MTVDVPLNWLSTIYCLFGLGEIILVIGWLNSLSATHPSVLFLAFKLEDTAYEILHELLSCSDPKDEATCELQEAKQPANITHDIKQIVD